MKRISVVIFAGLTFFAGGPAVEAECPPERDPALTLRQYLDAYRACGEVPAERVFAEGKKATEEKVSARPTSASVGGGFASGLRDTIEDFLPLFQIGVDSLTTSDDDRSLDIRFNPIRAGSYGVLGLTATVTEPKAGQELLKSLPEASRSTVAGLVEDQIDDFSNLTLTGRWGYERTYAWNEVPKRMWGRNVDRYRPIVEQWMGGVVEPEIVELFWKTTGVGTCEEEISRGLTGDAEGEAVEPKDATLGAIEAVLDDGRFERCLAEYGREEDGVGALALRLEAFSLLPALIDNQPQLVVTVARHERDPLVGRNGWGGKLVYEHGFHNFNRVLRAFHGEAKGRDEATARARAFWTAIKGLDAEKVNSENKLTFSAIYDEGDRLAFSRTFGEGKDAVTASVDLPRSTSWCVKGEYVRNATWHPMKVDDTTVFPRFHASLEYVDVSDDPQRQDRGIVNLTYELPVTASISVPLSLTYANHAEFLGDHDDELSAHLGFSYKLPWDDD